jgi:hypothetical protein
LRDEGFEIEVRGNYLVINHVPYVNPSKAVKFGQLVSELTLAGDKTAKPSTHVVSFFGEHPCHRDGSVIKGIIHSTKTQTLTEGVTVNHQFSNKPKDGYSDYYHKITRYIEIISVEAQSIDPTVTAKTFKVTQDDEEESVFQYRDSNSSRSKINMIAKKLKGHKIGIIGLGGTGSYILDHIAKTPVAEIHLFDGDKFLQHNSFRAPGAASIKDLEEQKNKAKYFQEIYTNMHKFIKAHEEPIGPSNIDLLNSLDFVFIAIDRGNVKNLIVPHLEKYQIPFIDVGMGVEAVNEQLIGILRTTVSVKGKVDHLKGRVSFSDDDEGGEYKTNIQISELNALNAAFAVIKWKKLCGFYHDAEKELNSTYTINVNMLLSDCNET